MAQPTKAELSEEIEKMGIKLTGEETVTDLKKIIEDNAERLDHDPRQEADVPSSEPKSAGDISRVVFHMNDLVNKTREFSEAVHGPEFLTIADTFAASNARKIRSREDL